MLATLDNKISSITADAAAAKLNQQEHERILQANMKDVQDKQKDKNLGGGMVGRRAPFAAGDRENMSMDVDEPDSKGKNRKLGSYLISIYASPYFVFISRASQEMAPKIGRKRNKF